MGKEHLYVWEKAEGMLHEDEAAERLRALCQSEHMHPTPVKEGKIELIADCDGLFQVDVARLDALNGRDELMIATRHTNTAVQQGRQAGGHADHPPGHPGGKAASRRRPMAGPAAHSLADALHAARPAASSPPAARWPTGLFQDAFTPVIKEKLASLRHCRSLKHCLPRRRQGGHHRTPFSTYRGQGRGPDPLHRRHERGPGRPDPGRHPGHRGGDRLLRRAGAAGCHVPAGLLRGRAPRSWACPAASCTPRPRSSTCMLPRIAGGRARQPRRAEGVWATAGSAWAAPECHYPICPFGKG